MNFNVCICVGNFWWWMEVEMCWKMKKCAEASAAATGVLVTIWGFPENLQSVVIKQVWFIRGWPEMGRWKRTRWKMFSKPLWKQIYEKILGHRKVRQGEMVLYGILGGTNYTLFCLQPFFPKKCDPDSGFQSIISGERRAGLHVALSKAWAEQTARDDLVGSQRLLHLYLHYTRYIVPITHVQSSWWS